jgi:hypothetical protein
VSYPSPSLRSLDLARADGPSIDFDQILVPSDKLKGVRRLHVYRLGGVVVAYMSPD